MKTLTIFFHSALVTGTLTLAGCSTLFNPVGESSFDCNRKENPSEFCRSFKALERSTSGSLPESRFDKEFKMSDFDRATGVAPDTTPTGQDGAGQKEGKAMLPHHRLAGTAEPLAGAPVRRAPVIQRVLIKSFVTENDELQGDTIVYKEVQASKWSGFDAINANNVAGAAAYPHKPKNLQGSLAEPSVQPKPPATNFSLPDNQDGLSETVSQPAVSGGNLTMPR